MQHRAPLKRYTVRELAWRSGSRRRLIDRSAFFSRAQRIAEHASRGDRQIVVEAGGQILSVWVSGTLVSETD